MIFNLKTLLLTGALIGTPALANADQHSKKQAGNPKDGKEAERMVMGEVQDARDVRLKGVAGNGHRLLKIKNSKGQQMVLNLGQPSNLGDLNLREGDTIIASGKTARINGKPVLFTKLIGKLYATGKSGSANQQTSAN